MGRCRSFGERSIAAIIITKQTHKKPLCGWRVGWRGPGRGRWNWNWRKKVPSKRHSPLVIRGNGRPPLLLLSHPIHTNRSFTHINDVSVCHIWRTVCIKYGKQLYYTPSEAKWFRKRFVVRCVEWQRHMSDIRAPLHMHDDETIRAGSQ